MAIGLTLFIGAWWAHHLLHTESNGCPSSRIPRAANSSAGKGREPEAPFVLIMTYESVCAYVRRSTGALRGKSR